MELLRFVDPLGVEYSVDPKIWKGFELQNLIKDKKLSPMPSIPGIQPPVSSPPLFVAKNTAESNSDRAERLISDEMVAVLKDSNNFLCCKCGKKVDRIERYSSDSSRAMGLRFICHGSTDDYEVSEAMLAAPRSITRIRPFAREMGMNPVAAASLADLYREIIDQNVQPVLREEQKKREVAELQARIRYERDRELRLARKKDIEEFRQQWLVSPSVPDQPKPQTIKKPVKPIEPPSTERKINLGID